MNTADRLVIDANTAIAKIRATYVQKVRDKFDGQTDSTLRALDVIVSNCNTARRAIEQLDSAKSYN